MQVLSFVRLNGARFLRSGTSRMKRGLVKFMISSAAAIVPVGVSGQEIGAGTSIVIAPELARDDVAGGRSEPAYRPVPVLAGPFFVQPRLSLVTGYESNVFNRPGTSPAAVFTAMPSLEARANLPRHALNLSAAGTVRRFSRYRSEDSEEFALNADGRLDLASQQVLTTQVDYAHLIEPRSSTGTVANSAEPVSYDRLRTEIGSRFQFGNLHISPNVAFQRVDYQPVSTTGGAQLDQRFRDTRSLQGAIRIDYDLSGFASVFVSGGYGEVTSTAAPAAIRRDSRNPVALAGIRGDLSPVIWAEIAMGYSSRNYETDVYRDFKGFTYQADLQWYVTPLMTLRAQADRSFRNGGNPQVAGILADELTVSAFYDPTRSLRVSASVSIERDNYRETATRAWRTSARLQAEWRLNRRLSLGSYARLLRQDVSGPLIVNDFTTLRIGLGITLTP